MVTFLRSLFVDQKKKSEQHFFLKLRPNSHCFKSAQLDWHLSAGLLHLHSHVVSLHTAGLLITNQVSFLLSANQSPDVSNLHSSGRNCCFTFMSRSRTETHFDCSQRIDLLTCRSHLFKSVCNETSFGSHLSEWWVYYNFYLILQLSSSLFYVSKSEQSTYSQICEAFLASNC